MCREFYGPPALALHPQAVCVPTLPTLYFGQATARATSDAAEGDEEEGGFGGWSAKQGMPARRLGGLAARVHGPQGHTFQAGRLKPTTTKRAHKPILERSLSHDLRFGSPTPSDEALQTAQATRSSIAPAAPQPLDVFGCGPRIVLDVSDLPPTLVRLLESHAIVGGRALVTRHTYQRSAHATSFEQAADLLSLDLPANPSFQPSDIELGLEDHSIAGSTFLDPGAQAERGRRGGRAMGRVAFRQQWQNDRPGRLLHLDNIKIKWHSNASAAKSIFCIDKAGQTRSEVAISFKVREQDKQQTRLLRMGFPSSTKKTRHSLPARLFLRQLAGQGALVFKWANTFAGQEDHEVVTMSAANEPATAVLTSDGHNIARAYLQQLLEWLRDDFDAQRSSLIAITAGRADIAQGAQEGAAAEDSSDVDEWWFSRGDDDEEEE
ncbi:hypothetical protein ACM66B_002039 [Microbotryomycetes sp. NB124-2]